MILSTLEFPRESLQSLVTLLFSLPEAIKPTLYSIGEDEVGEPVDGRPTQLETLAKRTSGFFLKGTHAVYDVNLAGSRPIICNCFLEVEPSLAKQFLAHMAAAQPIFGFACTQEERYQRNRVTVKQGINTIESWVGRDTQKYVPGFYWLTLLPDALAKQHGIPLTTVGGVALEHAELGDGQHMFRFYDRPGDWQATSVVAELCASLPGVFNIEKVKAQLPTAKNFLELNSMLRDWR